MNWFGKDIKERGIHMIFCILGKSASGKDSIFKRLSNHTLLQPIVTTTSRAIRSNEKEGVDYHYITEDDFETSINKCEFVEWTIFNGWYYGTKWDEFINNSKHKLIVVNPQGLETMINRFGSCNVVGIVIHRKDRDRLLSYLQRDENADVDEMIRRFSTDKHDFDTLNKRLDILSFNNIHYVENTTGQFDKCIYEVEKIIGGYLNEN